MSEKLEIGYDLKEYILSGGKSNRQYPILGTVCFFIVFFRYYHGLYEANQKS